MRRQLQLRTALIVLAFLSLASFGASDALATSYTYTYTGLSFTDFLTRDSNGDESTAPNGLTKITGYFTVSELLADQTLYSTNTYPITFSFTDGINTYTNENCDTVLWFTFSVSNGEITSWRVYLDSSYTGGSLNFYSLTTGEQYDCAAYTVTGNGYSIIYRGSVDAAGTWTLTENTSVPEPASMLLLGFGLIGLARLRKRIK